MTPRLTIVYEARIVDIADKQARIIYSVSSGTYIRSLAYDLGKALGFGAYLFSLKRVSIGDFKLEDAKDYDKVEIVNLKNQPL